MKMVQEFGQGDFIMNHKIEESEASFGDDLDDLLLHAYEFGYGEGEAKGWNDALWAVREKIEGML